MGSKRRLLENGLGGLLLNETHSCSRFIDLFSGSASVSHFVAEHTSAAVVSVDLQKYSRQLALAVTGRTQPLDPKFVSAYCDRIAEARVRHPQWRASETAGIDLGDVAHARRVSERSTSLLTRAYGGHYFSVSQAVTLDTALALLPREREQRRVLRAAILEAASKCSASPGHTAQPFAMTESALPHINAAWGRSPLAYIDSTARSLCDRFAIREGRGYVADAACSLRWIRPTSDDVVFVDPPYSAVQYSRFYHVLETIASGTCGDVSGRGRYPAYSLRPRSAYSLRSGAAAELGTLLERLQSTGCVVIVTYPNHECSNGLSGSEVMAMVAEHYHVESMSISNRFSTMGGTAAGRGARINAEELAITLRPHHSA